MVTDAANGGRAEHRATFRGPDDERKGWLAKGIEGRHVLIGLVAFFGVMLVANGIFVYYALETFAGGDTSDPYRKGMHYNETLAEAARQDERGW